MPEYETRQPAHSPPLRGDERFSFGPTVLEFWRWALGDLRMNTARGYLAEFLVASAVGSSAPIRVEWAAHDVDAGDGARLEVKASGYLQSWTQAESSRPSFSFRSVRAAKVWDPALGAYRDVDPEERVDAWIFALQTCRDPEAYDPLDAGQWDFRVVPHRQLLRSGQTSAGLSFFDRIGADPVGFGELAEAVQGARRANEALGHSG
jgi:hypothetical protein